LAARHPLWRRRFCLTWFVVHFLLIAAISCRETLWLVAHGLTNIPPGGRTCAEAAEGFVAGALGLNLPKSNLLRQTLASYLDCAGIGASYGYFAPNVPNGYRLVFELTYPDGHTERQLLRINSAAAGLRLASLLDQIGRTRSDAFREYMIKKEAAVVWREHLEAKTMRASLSQIVQPSIADFQRGHAEKYELLYAYDFDLAPEVTPQPQQ
jgi:hypothetical protein